MTHFLALTNHFESDIFYKLLMFFNIINFVKKNEYLQNFSIFY